jgi:uncharacterized protein (TIGR00159 family)
MFEPGQNLIPFSWRDLVDIIAVAFLFFHVIRFVRGTRAMAALNGLFLLLVLYVVAQAVGLYTLVWLLEKLFGSLFLVIVVLFHQDIRQALSSMNLYSIFRRKNAGNEGLIKILSDTCCALAEQRVGAIVVVERTVLLGDMMERGVKLDALVSQDLLATIFFPHTALHDGAVIVNRAGRVVAAGCVLPLAQGARQHYGTRHRAGIGISEVSDAVAIVVSEERGEVTVAQDGRLSNPLTNERLERILSNALAQ